MRKTIGITIKHLHLSEFSNGATQHVYTMAKLFQLLGWNAVLISEQSKVPDVSNNYMKLPVITNQVLKQWIRYNESKPDNVTFDCIMFFEWYENGPWIKQIRDTFNCRVIKYQAGNMYESILKLFLQDKEITPLKDLKYHTVDAPDRLWLSPHYATRAPVYDVIFNTKTILAPYLWDPYFIDRYIKQKSLSVNYLETQTRLQNKVHVAICEPNRDIQKCSMVPLIGACSGVKSDLIQHVGIFDYSNKLQQSIATILRDMGCFGMDHRTKFKYAARKPIPNLLQDYSMVLCHQNDHMLNYLYLEVAYLGFPVIHNSPMCKEIGYYYEGDDIDQMLEQIKEATNHHRERLTQYRVNALKKIYEYSVYNKEVQTEFTRILSDLGL